MKEEIRKKLHGLGLSKRFVKGLNGGSKRVGLVWLPRMGDWFNSYSPRNSNSNAEGPWAHWINLAVSVLQHPLTEKLAPELHARMEGYDNEDLYDEYGRYGGLQDEQLEWLVDNSQ